MSRMGLVVLIHIASQNTDKRVEATPTAHKIAIAFVASIREEKKLTFSFSEQFKVITNTQVSSGK